VKAVDFLAHLIADHVKAGGMAVVTSHQAIPLPPGQVVEL
jgi:ABC-type transport system involved in cytochrome c biogenesis ATPase subunit